MVPYFGHHSQDVHTKKNPLWLQALGSVSNQGYRLTLKLMKGNPKQFKKNEKNFWHAT